MEGLKIYAGDALQAYCAEASKLPQRRLLRDLAAGLESPINGESKIEVLYGLCYTGKSTMAGQAAGLIGRDAAMIRIEDGGLCFLDVADVARKLADDGFRCLFVDEASKIDDFPLLARELVGLRDRCKIVLTGTDSLAFWLTKDAELEGCSHFIHTTFVPFSEFRFLYENADFDEYIMRGGVFEDLVLDRAVIPDKVRGNIVDEYQYTAIARCLQNSVGRRLDGHDLGILGDLYNEDLLQHGTMLAVQKDAHAFFAKSLSKGYEKMDINSVIKECRQYLDISNDELHAVLCRKLGARSGILVPKLTAGEAETIEKYLFQMDVFARLAMYYVSDVIKEERKENILVQPGLRFAQILALEDAIVENSSLSAEDAVNVRKYVYDKCVGNLFEETVRFNVHYELAPRGYEVFKLLFGGNLGNGEMDMAVLSREDGFIDLYEIKHGSKPDGEWFKNLANENFLRRVGQCFAPVRNKAIIYNGRTRPCDYSGIYLKNINEFMEGIARATCREVAEITLKGKGCRNYLKM